MPAVLVVALALLVQGCQSWGMMSGTRDLPEDHFQHVWTLYKQCIRSQDVREAQIFADLLSRAALANEGQVVAVPDVMAPLIESLPVRLSVEPKAMAAACALHAGHTARQAGQPDRANRLFSLVLRRFHEPAYAFYVNEARAGLDLIECEEIIPAATPVSLR